MSHKERRDREISGLKSDILRSTRQLAKNKGWEGVSMRKICALIEYTAPVIYEHYPKGKKQILGELRDFGFSELQKALEAAALAAGADPAVQLAAMAEAAWEFAIKESDLYEVMFDLKGVITPLDDPSALRLATQPVMDAIRQLHRLEEDRDGWFFNWWAIVHGHACLAITGFAGGAKPKFRGYIREAVTRLAAEIR